jgi:hypothetical protein
MGATVAAAVLLAVQGLVFARWLAGLPYPFWTADPRVCHQHGALAGLPAGAASFWEGIEARVLGRR